MPAGALNSVTVLNDRTDFASRLVRSELLVTVPGVVHGVTPRVEELGLAHGNIGYGAPRDRDDAWEMRRYWCGSLGLDPHQLVTAHQVHGADVLVATAEDFGRGARPGSAPLGVADALITQEPGIALMTLHADCLPILLVDPVMPAVASVHAGWRGTALDVVGAAVSALASRFGARPERLLAYLGPSIGGCCYEVGDEVVAAWQQQIGDRADQALRQGRRRRHLDLCIANRLLLNRAGVTDERIDASDVCTRCQGDEWFSHRGRGPETGRFGAIIALTEHGCGY